MATQPTLYDHAFTNLIGTGHLPIAAAVAVAELYLDGKPRNRGKHKISRTERDTAFWTSGFLIGLTVDAQVDLICARDGVVFVLEVKSTYLRRSQRDAWLHGKATLRKAGMQLQRKVAAVRLALTAETDLTAQLGLDPDSGVLSILGWIVDTSIECDHQRFNGFLKVSMEEVLIALRDDRQFLNDPGGLFDGRNALVEQDILRATEGSESMYPAGFSATRLIEVIENQVVWDEVAAKIE